MQPLYKVWAQQNVFTEAMRCTVQGSIVTSLCLNTTLSGNWVAEVQFFGKKAQYQQRTWLGLQKNRNYIKIFTLPFLVFHCCNYEMSFYPPCQNDQQQTYVALRAVRDVSPIIYSHRYVQSPASQYTSFAIRTSEMVTKTQYSGISTCVHIIPTAAFELLQPNKNSNTFPLHWKKKYFHVLKKFLRPALAKNCTCSRTAKIWKHLILQNISKSDSLYCKKLGNNVHSVWHCAIKYSLSARQPKYKTE